jgi:hypothetical protein
MLIQTAVCDVCRVPGRPLKRYTITENLEDGTGKSRDAELCEEHSVVLAAFLEGKELTTSIAVAPGHTPEADEGAQGAISEQASPPAVRRVPAAPATAKKTAAKKTTAKKATIRRTRPKVVSLEEVEASK